MHICVSLTDLCIYTDVIQDHQRNSVPLSEFVDYVNHMHADRDDLFEEEFNVSALPHP